MATVYEVKNRSLNILHHGWLSRSITNLTLGYYPTNNFYIPITKDLGDVGIKLADCDVGIRTNITFDVGIRLDADTIEI